MLAANNLAVTPPNVALTGLAASPHAAGPKLGPKFSAGNFFAVLASVKGPAKEKPEPAKESTPPKPTLPADASAVTSPLPASEAIVIPPVSPPPVPASSPVPDATPSPVPAAVVDAREALPVANAPLFPSTLVEIAPSIRLALPAKPAPAPESLPLVPEAELQPAPPPAKLSAAPPDPAPAEKPAGPVAFTLKPQEKKQEKLAVPVTTTATRPAPTTPVQRPVASTPPAPSGSSQPVSNTFTAASSSTPAPPPPVAPNMTLASAPAPTATTIPPPPTTRDFPPAPAPIADVPVAPRVADLQGMEFQGSEQVQAMVERARLVQTPTGSEMHVGLRTDALGQINVHAVVRDSATGPVSVGATIAVQDHETRALLVRELPALQGHLQERNIRLDEIAVIPESLASGAGLQQQQAGSSPDAQRQQQQRAQLGAADSPVTPESDAPPAAAIWTPGDGRLSVRA